MDITRRAYSMPCRFFNNSDVVSVVRWQEAEPNAECIPFESIILSTQQEPEQGFEDGVGEVADTTRRTTLARAPRGLAGAHVCGTEEEFRNGGTRDPSLPPVRYGATGWPLCCDPPKRVRGGGAGSGHAAFTPSRRVIRGGGAGSGRAVYAVEPGTTDCPALVTTCAAATPGALDHQCNLVLGPISTNWRRWDVVPGADYELTIVGLFWNGMTWTLYEGASCAALTQIAEGFSVDGNATVNFTASAAHVWCRFIQGENMTRNCLVKLAND